VSKHARDNITKKQLPGIHLLARTLGRINDDQDTLAQDEHTHSRLLA
jgi:hypothetical protein